MANDRHGACSCAGRLQETSCKLWKGLRANRGRRGERKYPILQGSAPTTRQIDIRWSMSERNSWRTISRDSSLVRPFSSFSTLISRKGRSGSLVTVLYFPGIGNNRWKHRQPGGKVGWKYDFLCSVTDRSDAHLTERGRKFAKALAKFIDCSRLYPIPLTVSSTARVSQAWNREILWRKICPTSHKPSEFHSWNPCRWYKSWTAGTDVCRSSTAWEEL